MKTKILLILFLLSCFFPKLQQVKDTIIGYQKFKIFRDNKGYEPPSDYPWMKKTKIWLVEQNPFYGWIEPLGTRGNTLEEGNENLKKASIFLEIGTENFRRKNGQAQNGVCLDCELGYFAFVQLMDDFYFDTLQRQEKPNTAYGFVCGKSSPKEAFVEAWKSARKELTKRTNNQPLTYYFMYGINTEVPNDIKIKFGDAVPPIVAMGNSSSSIVSVGNESDYGYIIKNYKAPNDNAESYIQWIENFATYYKPYYLQKVGKGDKYFIPSEHFDEYEAWKAGEFDKVFNFVNSVPPIFTQLLKGKKINVKTSTKNNSQNNNRIKLKEQIISTPVVENKKNEKPENGNYEYIIHDIRRLEEYTNGKVRLIKDFNKNNGQLLKELFIDENGDWQEEKFYHENRKIKIHAIYKEGKLKTIYRYYQNGHLEKEEKYN
ncbi:MAG: hypothetical protein E2600_15220 [Chryseobacterium sp.]|nr:hypothetical protein [Chryseobacterium sp.]